MPIRTVRDLKRYLKDKGLSPEALGRETKISNMTLRRFLRKSSHSRISERYHVQLDFHENGGKIARRNENPELTDFADKDFRSLIEKLELDGANTSEPATIRKKLDDRLAHPAVGASLKKSVSFLWNALSTNLPQREKSLILGAFRYIAEPNDPSSTSRPHSAHLDHFAIIVMVTALVERELDQN